MFSTEVRREIETFAKVAGWEAAALLAVAEVESGGQPFVIVDGRKEPLIRFEGHYFHRRLSGIKRDDAVKAGLAAPKAGLVRNPRTQADRWKMLRRAAEIDIKAAYESTSWGVGQVMGAHWQWLGYGSVDELVNDARRGVYGQVKLMVRFIHKAGLGATMARHDWAAFAHGYNGPGYAKGGYHTKLADAYKRYRNLPPLTAEAPKPTEKPVEAQKPVPTTSDTGARPETLPAPTPESKRGVFAKLLALIGIGGGGTGAGAAAWSQDAADQLAAWVFFGGLLMLVVIMLIVWRRGRK